MAQEARETDTRCRIVRQAEEFFRVYGYQKTTVADIAKALRMSPANVYRFFDSKKAINEEVAVRLMGEVEAALQEILKSGTPPPERLARLLRTLHEMNAARYVADRKMHEMVRVAMEESWSIIEAHLGRVRAMLAEIIAEGVRTGDFSVRDPAVAAGCVHASFVKFCHPDMIAQCAGSELQGIETPIDVEMEAMISFALAGLGCRDAGV
jgi:AcrR family transcriptional regulator